MTQQNVEVNIEISMTIDAESNYGARTKAARRVRQHLDDLEELDDGILINTSSGD